MQIPIRRIRAELQDLGEPRLVKITHWGLSIGLDPFRMPGA